MTGVAGRCWRYAITHNHFPVPGYGAAAVVTGYLVESGPGGGCSRRGIVTVGSIVICFKPFTSAELRLSLQWWPGVWSNRDLAADAAGAAAALLAASAAERWAAWRRLPAKAARPADELV